MVSRRRRWRARPLATDRAARPDLYATKTARVLTKTRRNCNDTVVVAKKTYASTAVGTRQALTRALREFRVEAVAIFLSLGGELSCVSLRAKLLALEAMSRARDEGFVRAGPPGQPVCGLTQSHPGWATRAQTKLPDPGVPEARNSLRHMWTTAHSYYAHSRSGFPYVAGGMLR